jgi:proteasome lid subunit RPN8/RPN11
MENNRKPGGLAKFQVTDREECGLVVKREAEDETMFYVVRIPNHAAAADRYEIWQEDVDRVKAVLSEDESVYGFMHTHLPNHDCEPSDHDFEGAGLFPEMENLIYQPYTGHFVWYGPEVLAET